jgi:membrane protein DedA with SNARE-associated domain
LLGGLAWGAGFVTPGYLTGNSYKTAERIIGRSTAVVVLALALLALIV